MSELWPQDFRAAAEQVFGRLDRTTYSVVDRRVEHAFKVWRRRYSMTPQQEDYAWQLLAWAVLRGWNSTKKADPKSPYVYLRTAVAGNMERVVNDPQAHEGFKRRAGHVDVRSQLAEALT